MITSMETIKLPLATNATCRGPVLEAYGSSLVLKYDHEGDSGAKNWVAIHFEDVLAYEVYQSVCAAASSLVPSTEMRCHRESKWLSDVITRWNDAAGWQEHQKRLGGAMRFRHYQICFDDVCAFQVIAATCKVAGIVPPVNDNGHCFRGPWGLKI